MNILTKTSRKSRDRGYEYYKNGNVLYYEKSNDTHFTGAVTGSKKEPYRVQINLDKPLSSECECPFANGNKICKHMVAVFFKAFPDEAKKYKDELDACWEDEEKRAADLDELLHKYIKKLSKAELQEALLQVLYTGPEWQYERFIKENIEW